MTARVIVPEEALVLFDDSEKDQLSMVVGELHVSERMLGDFTIQSQDDSIRISNGLARAKTAMLMAEDIRKKQVKPLNDQVKSINGAWRPITELLEAIEVKGKRILLAWNQRERERIAREQEAARKLQEEAARMEQEALAKAAEAKSSKQRDKQMAVAEQAGMDLMRARVAEPMNAPRGIRTDEGTSSTTFRWAFQVVDPQLVPRQYLVVDEKAIRRAVAEGARDIPGVCVYQEEGLAVRVAGRS